MKSLSICAFVLLVFMGPLAFGADTVPGQSSTLAGHYYLEEGPREVGSEMRLKDSGQFEWALVYGATNFAAQGTWEFNGKRLVITPSPKPKPNFRIFSDADYDRTKPAEPGLWIAVVGVPHVGPVAEIEVRFEARSGKAAIAVSQPNGDAIVKMPANEVWTRTGLRRAGSSMPWQWFDVKPQRSRTRLIGFALTNLAAVQHAPFATLMFRVEPSGLVIDDDASALHGTYVKH